MKALRKYESPLAEFIGFKNDSILASSTSCKCYGQQVYYETYQETSDPDSDCEAVTWYQDEVVPSFNPFPF